jgi:hypothetical protein
LPRIENGECILRFVHQLVLLHSPELLKEHLGLCAYGLGERFNGRQITALGNDLRNIVSANLGPIPGIGWAQSEEILHDSVP